MIYNEAFNPIPVLLIEDPEILKVLVQAQRTRILGLLGPRPRTVKEMGAELGIDASRLYYHVKLLLKAGLIVAVGERRLGNLTEVSYRARALDFDASPVLGSREGGRTAFEDRLASVADLMASSIKAAAKEIGRRLEERESAPPAEAGEGDGKGGSTLILRMAEARLGPRAQADFAARLGALLDEFSRLPEEAGEGGEGEASQPYALSLAFYPQAGSVPAKE